VEDRKLKRKESCNLAAFDLKEPSGRLIDVVRCPLYWALKQQLPLRDGLPETGFQSRCVQEARAGMVCAAPHFPHILFCAMLVID